MHATRTNVCYEKAEDIWYSREDYRQFHLDRFRTVECIRASGGDGAQLNPDFYCCRGLEPFMTPLDVSELNSSRRIHKSTIMLEQARQNLLKINDPERYRVMVAPQSEFALRRAQELASFDENEIYPPMEDHFPRSRMSEEQDRASPPTLPRTSFKDMPLSLSNSPPVRTMQEYNARRLMEIYSDGGKGKPSFRFPIRRDSLVGALNTMRMTQHFPMLPLAQEN